MSVTSKTLNKNIRLLRHARGISQETLSSVIHLARTTYSSYETGAKCLDLQTIDALARLYDVSFDSLVNYDLSEGILNRIYFSEENKDLAALLNSYQSLSVSSKYLICQRMNILIEKEAALYKKK